MLFDFPLKRRITEALHTPAAVVQCQCGSGYAVWETDNIDADRQGVSPIDLLREGGGVYSVDIVNLDGKVSYWREKT